MYSYGPLYMAEQKHYSSSVTNSLELFSNGRLNSSAQALGAVKLTYQVRHDHD